MPIGARDGGVGAGVRARRSALHSGFARGRDQRLSCCDMPIRCRLERVTVLNGAQSCRDSGHLQHSPSAALPDTPRLKSGKTIRQETTRWPLPTWTRWSGCASTSNADGSDLLREMVRTFAEPLMAAEVEVLCNAGQGESTAEWDGSWRRSQPWKQLATPARSRVPSASRGPEATNLRMLTHRGRCLCISRVLRRGRGLPAARGWCGRASRAGARRGP
jgi:hypothetical protein